MTTETTILIESAITTMSSNIKSREDISSNMTNLTRPSSNSTVDYKVFEAFVIIEIIMTAMELFIWIMAAIKIQKWMKNYRNQMLLQISVVRFIKRLVFLIVFLKDMQVMTETKQTEAVLLGFQFYLDFVLVILVFFFIRHMYDTLIVVLVKISEQTLYKVLAYSWLLPIPISLAGTLIITEEVFEYWSVYLLICCLIRWPLMLVGTVLYLTILYKLLNEEIMRFTRSLTVITFLMCLIINFYLFSKDAIELWCLHNFTTILVSYISGFLLNLIILSFYSILIMLNLRSKNLKSSKSIYNVSVSVDK